jgi:cytochrome c oxidase subunit II
MQINPRSWLYWAIFISLGLLILFIPSPAAATAPTTRSFQIDAKRFEYNPAILKVNQGDVVSIDLVATDVVHGLSIDGYNLEVTADPGKTAHLAFVADQGGTFRFHCTVTCGNMHPFMSGKLEVGQNVLLWRGVALAGLALAAGIRKEVK